MALFHVTVLSLCSNCGKIVRVTLITFKNLVTRVITRFDTDIDFIIFARESVILNEDKFLRPESFSSCRNTGGCGKFSHMATSECNMLSRWLCWKIVEKA